MAAKANAYVTEITASSMADRTVVSCVSREALALVRQQGVAGLRYSLITDSRGAVPPAEARDQGTIYMPRYTTLTKESVQEYHRLGVQIWAWGRPTRTRTPPWSRSTWMSSWRTTRGAPPPTCAPPPCSPEALLR